jgi:CubicO group peptidase (beta-lactamase class C family)
LTTGKVSTPGGGRYGYGFGELAMDELRCFGHTGGAPGMGGSLWACPTSGYVVTVLANVDPLAMIRISDFIVNRMPMTAP